MNSGLWKDRALNSWAIIPLVPKVCFNMKYVNDLFWKRLVETGSYFVVLLPHTSDAIGHWSALSLCPLTLSPKWSLASPAQEKPSLLLREQPPDVVQYQEELGLRAVPVSVGSAGGSELLPGFTFVFLTRLSTPLMQSGDVCMCREETLSQHTHSCHQCTWTFPS